MARDRASLPPTQPLTSCGRNGDVTARTLGELLSAHGASGALHAEAVVDTVVALARGAVAIRDAVTMGARGTAFAGSRQGTAGAGGDIP